ncbi:sugar phosphatase YidA [Salmonella enterica subsp. enterica serovar Choleraesuis]|nr:sugar phosphatase YidA [Salmonella enterica subsp. enterica serovar Choleraesuis]
MTIKLIAIDMDGTLLDPQHAITPEVHSAISAARARGIVVVLTTGRPYPGIERYLNELGMRRDTDYCITYNGALVQKAATGETVVEITLGHEDYRYLQQLSLDLGVHLHAIDRTTVYTANRDISHWTVHEAYLTGMPLQFCEAENMDPSRRYPKIMMIDDPEILDVAIAKIPAEVHERYTILKSAPFYLEMLDRRVDKGAGVQALAETLGIDREEVMAIGDQENDIAMLEYAGIGVAMGNAIDSVKNVAQVVTKTNEEHGVAVAIRQYALGEKL